MLDPCVMFVSCLAEPTADFRRTQANLWSSSFSSTPAAPTCGPVEIGFSRIAPFQNADGCAAAASIGVDLSTTFGGGGPVTEVTAGGIPVSATTQYGDIIGRHSRADGVNRFYGVRFGATTSGANRFKAPQTPASWSTPQQAITHTGCAQWSGSAPAWSGSPGWLGSEDCLFLSIVTPNAGVPGIPSNAAANTYPVQFWIYGGGFAAEAPPFYMWKDDFYVSGSSNLGYLPQSGKGVSAFVNYRVNFLGGLSHPALRGGISGSTQSGNWGIQDVHAGLVWVQNNIGNFGGDPTKVTIQGESAGATTVVSIVTSPLFYPPNVPAALFRGAIAQSVWPMMDNGVAFSQNVRDVAGNAMAWATQCSTVYDSSSTASAADLAAIAACLRSPSTDMAEALQAGFTEGSGAVTSAVYSAFETANGGTGVMTYINWQTYGYSPCVDGYVWTKAPKDHAIDGVGTSVHLIVGNNANEESLFAPSYVGLNTPSYIYNNGYFYAMYGNQLSHLSTAIDFVTVGNSMPTTVLQNLPYYTAVTDDWQRQTQQLDDGYFSANIALIFDTFSAQPGRAANSLFRFVFAEPNGPNQKPFMGTPHTAELNYVWGLYAMGKNYAIDLLVQGTTPKTVYTAAQIAMGDTIQKYWANFIHTGSPTVTNMNAPVWEGITVADKHTMVFQSSVHHGAMLDPCVMFVSCLPEPTADFRRSQSTLWRSSFAETPVQPSCSGAIDIGFSRIAPFQNADGCAAAADIPSPSPAISSPSPPASLSVAPPSQSPSSASSSPSFSSRRGNCGAGCKAAFFSGGLGVSAVVLLVAYFSFHGSRPGGKRTDVTSIVSPAVEMKSAAGEWA